MLPKWRSFPRPPGYVDKRAIWKRRISLGYLFFSTNAFLLVMYSVIKGKGDWVDYFGLRDENEEYKSASQIWADKLNVKNARYVRVSGFNVEDVTEKLNKNNVKTPQNEDKEEL